MSSAAKNFRINPSDGINLKFDFIFIISVNVKLKKNLFNKDSFEMAEYIEEC